MERLLRLSLAVCVVSVLSACPQKPAGECGGIACSSTERCDKDALKCVTDQPPMISLTIPGVVSDPTFVATGTVLDDESVKTAEWRSGSSDWIAISLEANGSFSFTVPAPLVDAQDVVVSIRARDAIQEATLDKTTKVDRIGPTAVLLSPDAGSMHNTATIDVALKVTDGSGSLSDLSVNGAAVTNPMSGATVMTSLSIPATADGVTLNVPVVAHDSRGNATTTMFSFVGDRVAPQVAITSPAANALIATPTVTLTFTATDPSGVASANCSNAAGDTAVATTTAPNTWSCELPVAIAERPEQLSVVVLDGAGNPATAMQTIQIDRIAPVVTITAPNSGTIFGSAFPVSANTTGAATSVTARLTSGTSTSLSGGPTWTGTVAVPMHDYAAEVLVVEATDAAGNVGSASANIFTDTAPPVITFTAPMPNQKFNIASFMSGPTTVRSTWTISDADATAATSTVEGLPATGLQYDAPTQATDNGATYTIDVVVRDRAGNSTSGSITYSVDRVAPTVTAWTPAANARLVFPRTSSITFSEPVTTSVNGLVVVGQTQPSGSWTGNTFNLNLDPFALRAIDLSIAALTDAHGNPIAPATRRIHLGTGFARGTNLIIGSGPVLDYDASSDADGVLTIALMTRGGATTFGDELVEVYRDTGSAFTAVTPPSGFPANISAVQTSSWNVVNADLSSSARFGVGVTQFPSGTNHRFWSVDGVAGRDSSSSPLAVVSRPRLGPPGVAGAQVPQEPADNPIGGIVGSTYSRLNNATPYTVTLPQPTGAGVVQSNSNWTTFSLTGSAVLWSRFYCWFGQITGRECSAYARSFAASSPDQLQAAVTRGGGCMLVSWNEGAQRRGSVELTSACEAALNGCAFNGTTSTSSASNIGDIRAGTWDVNGEDTLLHARPIVGGAQVDKMTGCGFSGTPAATFSLAGLTLNAQPTRLRPVRVGDLLGVLYLDSAGVLRLAIQP